MNESDFHNYQHRAKKFVMDNPFCGLFLDMGLGKTVTILSSIQSLIYEELDINTALVIAPKRVAESVWTAEAEKWEHLHGLKIVKIIGTEKQRKAAMREKADIYMISRDNVLWLTCQFGGLMLPYDMLVVDESSSFKDPSTNRFKALKKVQPSFRRVVIMTGTPAPTSLLNLWPQIYLLDRGQRLGQTITMYKDRFFYKGYNGFDLHLQENAQERIQNQIKDICISMEAKDYLDLKEPIINDIIIPFPPDIQAKYTDFERTQVLEMMFAGDEITAINAAALTNKLLQFANGAVYDEDKNFHVMHSLKLDEAESIVENAQGKPVLIAYTFKSDYERLMVRLKKYKPVKLSTDEDIKAWNRGEIKVMIMHPASGGHGLNLQAGGNIILWYGQTWSLELYMQFNARLARQGQEEVVVINRLIAQGTIDEDVIQSQIDKKEVQQGVIDATKVRLDKYEKYISLF